MEIYKAFEIKMDELISNEDFDEFYSSFRVKIYAIDNENIRDLMMDSLKEIEHWYTSSRGKAIIYLDNVDMNIDDCFTKLEEQINLYWQKRNKS